MTYIQSSSISNTVPTDAYSNYEAPSIFSKDGSLKPEKQLHGEIQIWIRDAIQEGKTFLKSCRGYSHIETAIDIICKETEKSITGNPQQTTSNLSNVWANNIKRQIKEICCTLSNIRPSWIYEANSSRDKQWLLQSSIANGLSNDWYNESNVDIILKKLLELGTVEGTGYISPVWNPYHSRNGGGIELKLYRYNEVLPIQISRDYDLQKAYAVILVDEMPINRARMLFPTKRQFLFADRGETRMARSSILYGATTAIKGFWDVITDGDRSKKKTYPSPVVDILNIYVDDYSINPNPYEIEMGEDSWKYTVPYVGQQIFDGYDSTGQVKTRKALPKDCLLYPNRRLIIASKTCILYDGPSFWWHRSVPIVKYSPDEWVFSYLGMSMAAEVLSLDQASNKMRRDIEDALRLKIDPPLAVDEISMSKTQAESNTLRRPGKRIRMKLAMGEAIKPILEPGAYDVGTDHFLFVEKTEDKIKEILGIQDLRALMQARQVPSSDTISQFFSQAGAVVTSMSRALDPVMKFIAECNLSYFFQFYSIEKRIKILGQDGITPEDFDFAPATLIPQSLPGEPRRNPSTGVIDETYGIYQSSMFERAKWHLSNFRCRIEATSLHQITHMQRKLLLMQATKLIPGYPMIDPETLAKELDIPNWGHLDGDTIQEKVLTFMKQTVQFQIASQAAQMELQMKAQMMMQQSSPEGQMSQALGGISQALQNESSNGNKVGLKRPEGHPPSFDKAPELSNRPSGTTITTS